MHKQYLQFQKAPPKKPIPHSAKIRGSRGSHDLQQSQGHLFLTGTFGLTKPALVWCLVRHLFLIYSVCFNKARWYVLRNAVRLFAL